MQTFDFSQSSMAGKVNGTHSCYGIEATGQFIECQSANF